MAEPVLTCPYCKKEIKLTESLAAPIVDATRREYEGKLAEKDAEVATREAAIRQQQQAIEKAQGDIEQKVADGVRKQREKIAAEELKKARMLVSEELSGKSQELATLQEILKAKDEKLAAAQNAQADLIRKQRELDDAKRELELTVEERVQESLVTVRDKAKREAEEALKLKVTEKEQTILSMQREIDSLKRKAEQGSQQLQGEVQELELEELLSAKFPVDIIEPVPKGEYGGDIVQQVVGTAGQICGKILWESKRTKNWTDSWLAKLRGDQRAAKADFAVLVSRALPKGLDSFDLVDGIWVVDPRFAIPVCMVLRQALHEVSVVRQASAGQETKMGMMYQYLTGPRFRSRVAAIVEKISDMEQDLTRERTTMTRLWAKREEQIRTMMESTAGMYGDLQGIAGKSLEEIEGLEIPMLPSPEHEQQR